MPEPRLVLASASPRRRELLALLGVSFSVVATSAEESGSAAPSEGQPELPPFPLPPAVHPSRLAWQKVQAARVAISATSAEAGAEAGAQTVAEAGVVLGADTIVVLDGEVLNKPRDASHARDMLTRLAGRGHTVYTGLCVYCSTPRPEGHFCVDLVATEVTLRPLQAGAIAAYVASGEPLDKAGAYGIQGEGGRFVSQVVGSYTSVVGLPLPATWHLLTAAGITGLNDPVAAYHSWLRRQRKEPLPCPPTLP
ncbi:MAG: septum formation protein Maf [Chloroflexaceae bacterium]|nr:septum formation protein Maf [Chloroflexaceae bacterium]